MSEFRVFQEWPKISRWDSPVTITEKIDGTNSCFVVDDFGQEFFCQSRNKIITPQDDNAGFARWAHENAASLIEDLGPGRHFGEWWA